MIGHPAPSREGVRNSNHGQRCDRRDGWVGPKFRPERLQASLGDGCWLSTRAKWRSFQRARGSVSTRCLTEPTLLEIARHSLATSRAGQEGDHFDAQLTVWERQRGINTWPGCKTCTRTLVRAHCQPVFSLLRD